MADLLSTLPFCSNNLMISSECKKSRWSVYLFRFPWCSNRHQKHNKNPEANCKDERDVTKVDSYFLHDVEKQEVKIFCFLIHIHGKKNDLHHILTWKVDVIFFTSFHYSKENYSSKWNLDIEGNLIQYLYCNPFYSLDHPPFWAWKIQQKNLFTIMDGPKKN